MAESHIPVGIFVNAEPIVVVRSTKVFIRYDETRITPYAMFTEIKQAGRHE